MFQIGELDIDLNYKNNIISLLNLGNKFMPNYFFSKKDYFNCLLTNIDKSLLNLNTNIFFKSQKKHNYDNNLYDSLDKDLNEFRIDEIFFNKIYKIANLKLKGKKVKT